MSCSSGAILKTFKLWDDSYNYVKHERASLRMAIEFKHEIVPGKAREARTAKKQEDFPRQKFNKDEAQYEQAHRPFQRAAHRANHRPPRRSRQRTRIQSSP